MEMIGYLGKKVDLTCLDGKRFSGYVFDILDEEDSDLGCEGVDLLSLDRSYVRAIATNDIKSVVVDESYKEIDFRA